MEVAMKKRMENAAYFSPARRAAALEQAGHFKHAAPLWRKASPQARNPINEQWALHRAEFCEYQSN